jgi:hypothetical protein
VQPTQLSLLPDQVPAPPAELASQLPATSRSAATAILARLIAQAVRATPGPGLTGPPARPEVRSGE